MRYTAFLRAINVGGHNVKMDVLRDLFEAMGLAQVQTYIASGNVIFETPGSDRDGLEAQIEARLQAALGYAVPALLRTDAEVIAMAQYQPFDQAAWGEESRLYVSLLKQEPDEAVHQQLITLTSEIDQFHIHQREVYWLNHRHKGDSPLTNANIEKALGIVSTRRNINTIQKIAKKYYGF